MTTLEQFFYENAGSSYNPLTETLEQGKQRGAVQLTRATRYATEHDWSYQWVEDQAGCSGCDCGSPECACSTGADHETLCCILRDADGTVLESLSGICGATREYGRIVEAELALEAMPSDSGAK